MGKMCPNCGNILSDQAKFCPKCGTKQETQTRQEGKFCLFCGATLEPGACVGAGFAVFESAGYAFQCLLSTGADSAMMDITLLRGVLAVGGHVVWTAIAGAALAAAKGEEMFNIQQLISGRFLFFFAISVILHGVWDCPLQFLGAYGKYIVLIVLAWVVTLTLISSGLKQITRLAQQKGNENQ